MRYSTWLWMNVAAAIVVFVIFSALFLEFLGELGLALTVFFGLLLLLSMGLSVARMRRAMDEYGGTPMSGFWGALGLDIVPDDDEDDNSDGGPESNDGARPAPSRAPALPEDAGPSRRSPVVAEAPGSVCRACGAFTEGVGSEFCRVCGAPL